MPLVTRFQTSISRRFTRNFASKAARFQLAVTAGFFLVVIGVLTVGLDARNGEADGFFESLFGGQSMFGQQAPVAMAGYSTETGPRRQATRRHREHVRSVRFKRDQDDGDDHISAGAGSHSVCIRLCDGFAFPVGTYHGSDDLASHEATCHSECPGAATALYTLPAGADSVSEAVSVRTGQSYSELPDAFHYTTMVNEACTCHPASGGRIKSLLHDFTLRRGDAVMTRSGFQVFHGGAHYPFRRKDFMALNHSPDIGKNVRATYKAIERASLIGNPTVIAKATEPAAPAAVSLRQPTGTKALEHQASR